MLHGKVLLVWLDTVVLVHELIHAAVETVAWDARVLLVLWVVLIANISASAHNRRIIIIINVLLVGRGRTALDLTRLYLFGVVRAASAIVRAASHFLKDYYLIITIIGRISYKFSRKVSSYSLMNIKTNGHFQTLKSN